MRLFELFLFVLVALLIGFLFFLFTRRDIYGKWREMLAGTVANNIRGRNRMVFFVTLVVFVILALSTLLIPPVMRALNEGIYAMGFEPILWGEFPGVLYLGLFFGIMVGLYLGSLVGCKTSETTRYIRLGQIVF